MAPLAVAVPRLLCWALLLHVQHALFIASGRDSLLEKVEEYQLVTPQMTDSLGRPLPTCGAGGGHCRVRRDAKAQSHAASAEEMFYNVTVFGRELHLRLRRNSRLAVPGATVEWQEGENMTRTELLQGLDCLYVGDVTGQPNASVAISTCGGLVRLYPVAQSPEGLEPLPSECALLMAVAIAPACILSSRPR